MLFQQGMWGGRKPQEMNQGAGSARTSLLPTSQKTLENQKKTPKKSTSLFAFFPGAPETPVHPFTYHNIF
jgi:hypothetical protein